MKIFPVDYKEYIINMEEKDVVLIDPPWSYNDKLPAVRNQVNYSLWNNNMKFLFENVRTKYFLVWVTNSFVEKVFYDYFNSNTEFQYKTLITWCKLTRKGRTFYGLGNHFRNATEHILVFVKKEVKPVRLAMRNILMEKVGKRTVKPKVWEMKLFKNFEEKGYKKFAYIFCGYEINWFKEFDIDLVDICLKESQYKFILHNLL